MTIRATQREMISREVKKGSRGVEVVEFGSFLGPTERGVGPKGGTEPCIEDVGIAIELMTVDGIHGEIIRAADEPTTVFGIASPRDILATGESLLQI